MRAWVARFASLYVFDVVVLLLIGAFTPGVRVGWSALWAGVILAAATIWLKPLIHRWFRSMAARSSVRRSKIAEKGVQYGLVLAVAAIIWALLVVFTGVHVGGFFFLWGWITPPIALTIAWAVYDLIDDGVEARATRLLDRATKRDAAGSGRPSERGSQIPHAPRPWTSAAYPGARSRQDDELSDEQRRMLDEL